MPTWQFVVAMLVAVIAIINVADGVNRLVAVLDSIRDELHTLNSTGSSIRYDTGEQLSALRNIDKTLEAGLKVR
jgi:hypothetical protein